MLNLNVHRVKSWSKEDREATGTKWTVIKVETVDQGEVEITLFPER